jgi:hypothetical protein
MSGDGENNGNSRALLGIFGAALTALVLGFGAYVASGAQKASQVESEMRVYKATIDGRLDVLLSEQQRMRLDIQKLTESVDRLAARRDK